MNSELLSADAHTYRQLQFSGVEVEQVNLRRRLTIGVLLLTAALPGLCSATLTAHRMPCPLLGYPVPCNHLPTSSWALLYITKCLTKLHTACGQSAYNQPSKDLTVG